MAPAAPPHRRADGHRRARARPAVRVRGQRRGREGRGDQAPRRAAGPPPLPGDVVRQADVRREAPSVPLALLPVRAGPRRDVGVRPQLVRPGARRAGRGLRHGRGVGSGVRGDRQLRAHQLARGRDHRQVLAADQRRGAAAPLRGSPERSAPALEDHRRGLAQPQEGRSVRDRRRGDVRAHGPPPRAVGHHLGRAEATRPGPGAGAADHSGSSRAWSASARRCRRPTSCRPSPTELPGLAPRRRRAVDSSHARRDVARVRTAGEPRRRGGPRPGAAAEPARRRHPRLRRQLPRRPDGAGQVPVQAGAAVRPGGRDLGHRVGGRRPTSPTGRSATRSPPAPAPAGSPRRSPSTPPRRSASRTASTSRRRPGS